MLRLPDLREVVNRMNIVEIFGKIFNNKHFKITKVDTEGNEELHIRFHKGVVLSIINKYYAHDKQKHIREDAFLSYAKSHTRYRGNVSVSYDGENPANSMCFDIQE